MDSHELQIVVSSAEASELKASKSLRNWLKDEEFDSGFEVKQARKKLEEDEAGGELLAAIGVNVASAIVTEFGSSLFGWMKSKSKRDKSLSITIKTKGGHEIAISGNDIGQSEQVFIENLVQLMNNTNDSAAKPTTKKFPDNWSPVLSESQWLASQQLIQTNIIQGDTKNALNVFDQVLEKENLLQAQSIIKVRMGELERTQQAQDAGTLEQGGYDRTINSINKVILDLLNQITELRAKKNGKR